MPEPPLWHYTCEHGRAALGDAGLLLPMSDPRRTDISGRVVEPFAWLMDLVWCTDLDVPVVAALGLTMDTIGCDRTRHRYRVVDPAGLMPWHRYARELTRRQRVSLEAQRGGMPAHWWVATGAVPVVYDP